MDLIEEYIVIDETSRIGTDFSFVPQQARMVLITSPELAEELTPRQRKAIDRIVVVPTIDFSTILKEVKNNRTHGQATRLIAIDERLLPIVAQVREILHIPGPTVHEILPFCDKIESKRRLQGSPVHYPKFMEFDYAAFQQHPETFFASVQHYLTFPILVKPRNLSGAHGIQKLHTLPALQTWCRAYHPDQMAFLYGEKIGYSIEEWIDTDAAALFHCDSIIQNGKVLFTIVAEYTYPCLAVTQGKPVGSIALPFDDERYKLLSNIPDAVIQAFSRYASIPDGVMHLEAFYHAQSGQITFLETQLRYPGLDICTMYQLYLNLDWEAIHWQLQMELPIDSTYQVGPYVMWMYVPTQEGVIDALLPPTNLKSKIHKLQYRIQAGQKTSLPKAITLCDHAHKTALQVLLTNSNYQALWEDFNFLKTFQPFSLRANPQTS